MSPASIKIRFASYGSKNSAVQQTKAAANVEGTLVDGAISSVTADRIACSCVTCPKCGTWIVVRESTQARPGNEEFRASCPVPECGKEFEFEPGEAQVFDLPLLLFEGRHFYRSELL
jgi:DNA-directed RNA polymerase subunit M/transcription elongation factor TFIIS